ncbi:MAG TPA: acyltransferase [Acidimicrobiales bacterium]|nr:acyltransferase [Acidimicrobiales bacterium]
MTAQQQARWALELVFNRLITHIPHNGLRLTWLRLLGMHAGPHTYIYGDCDVDLAAHISLEGQVHIGRRCLLDGRGGLSIGKNVVIGARCLLITADHDLQDPGFRGRTAPIVIEDRVWIGSHATILKGVTLGEGCVVAAGAIVTKSVDPWTVVAGVPARPIGSRSQHQTYEMTYGPTWW